MNALFSKTKLCGIAHIDVRHRAPLLIDADNTGSDRAQQVIGLATIHCYVEMQRAARLFLNDGDIVKLLVLPHTATKPVPMFQGRFAVGHILPISQRDHAISADHLAAFTYVLFSSPNLPLRHHRSVVNSLLSWQHAERY